MLEEGLFERFPVDEVFGLHNLPGLPFGKFMACKGSQMASADFFEVTLHGRGGHAAWPHRCDDLPLLSSELLLSWQKLVSRRCDPLESVVLSVTQIHGGESDNALPSTLKLSGTVRALSEPVRQRVEEGMYEILNARCAEVGVSAEWSYEHRYAVTVNTESSTDRALQVAERLFGPEHIERKPVPLSLIHI